MEGLHQAKAASGSPQIREIFAGESTPRCARWFGKCSANTIFDQIFDETIRIRSEVTHVRLNACPLPGV